MKKCLCKYKTFDTIRSKFYFWGWGGMLVVNKQFLICGLFLNHYFHNLIRNLLPNRRHNTVLSNSKSL